MDWRSSRTHLPNHWIWLRHELKCCKKERPLPVLVSKRVSMELTSSTNSIILEEASDNSIPSSTHLPWEQLATPLLEYGHSSTSMTGSTLTPGDKQDLISMATLVPSEECLVEYFQIHLKLYLPECRQMACILKHKDEITRASLMELLKFLKKVLYSEEPLLMD